jgi:multidrug efflux pump subunit AcrA (membrane-fusion protein)
MEMNELSTSYVNAVDEADAIRTSQHETPSEAIATNNGTRTVRALGRSIPTVAVLALLIGIAIWGHLNEWRMPKFSALLGKKTVVAEAWCDEHGVPEAICISCNAELMPKGKLFGWCTEHGVHECVLHNPQTAQLAVPPEVTRDDFDRATSAIAVRPRTENDSACKMHLRRIQFASIESADRAGIDIAIVDRSRVVETIKTMGEIVYDPTLVAHLASRAEGTIWRVEKNVGNRVEAGDVLAFVDAVVVGEAKSELMQALVQRELNHKTLNRLAGLQGAVPGYRVLDAETELAKSEVAVQQATQKLSNLGLEFDQRELQQQSSEQLKTVIQFLGIPATVRETIDQSVATSNLVPIIAPRGGLVVKRDAAAGEVVGPTSELFTIAETNRMWLQLKLRLEEAKRVQIGQKIIFRPDGTEEDLIGFVSWISTDVDTGTRTVMVRGELDNLQGQLRNETFGAGEIVLRDEPNAIVVPDEAIHWEGCCHVAFVRDKNYFQEDSFKVFHTRSVRPGAKKDGYTEVIVGLLPGEIVVTKGSGVLRAELLKGNLGAG